jgi:tripartite-type tricarboxylate transporter receptor subunit TctC
MTSYPQQTIDTGGLSMRMTGGAVAALALIAFAALPASAQEYPAREIKTICSFAPGTGADIVVRFYATKMGDVAGKPVVTENRPGAQGLLGTEAIARAKPDGYTMAFNPVGSTLAASQHIFKKLSFDPMKDVESVALMLTTTFVLVVDPKRNLNSVADLTKFLKEKKGDANYGGSTNSGIVASEIYNKAIGVDVKRVNYRSAFDALNEMAAGNIDYYFTDATTALGQIAAGRYKALATTGAKRSASFPDLPTLKELGYDVDLAPFWGVIVPAGTPQAVKDKLATWTNKINAMPDTQEFLKKNGLEPLTGDAKMMREMIIKDAEHWAKYVRIANIEAQ